MAGERILVVDDNRMVLEMVADRLREEGMEVVTAQNGLEALQLTQSHRFDLILLDILIPWLNGLEVARLLKADARTAAIPIIFLTVKDKSQDKVTGLQLGADDYITKPFEWEELVARVHSVLRRAVGPLKASPKAKGIAGGLADVSLATLIQLIETDKKSGVLTLIRGEESGYILFNEGQIVNAVVGKLQGEAAVYELLAWNEGGFAFEPYHTPAEPGIVLSNQALIMEGIRRMDERRWLLAHLPDLGARLRAKASEGLDPDLQRLLGLFDGTRDLRTVLRDLQGDPLEALKGIEALYRRGLLERIE
ncbi:MAG: response regulator, partial [Candidatus Methylomirabilales bacterium]